MCLSIRPGVVIIRSIKHSSAHRCEHELHDETLDASLIVFILFFKAKALTAEPLEPRNYG